MEKTITEDALAALVNYSWPGNVRELENVIERAAILSGGEIDSESLPPKIRKENESYDAAENQDSPPTLDEKERQYVIEILDRVNGHKGEASQILGIDLSTLYRKLKRYGLS
jgi:DNA-binding NtrC family response regulator